MTQLEYDYMSRMPRLLHQLTEAVEALTEKVAQLTEQVRSITEHLPNDKNNQTQE